MLTPNQIKHTIVSNLIRRATPAELILNRALSNAGIRFVFQRPFRTRELFRMAKGREHDVINESQLFVADFYLPQPACVIEIDGSSHNHRYHYDTKRQQRIIQDRKMVKLFLRFTNKDVGFRLAHVMATIQKLKPVRCTPNLNHQQRIDNRKHNAEIARLNEIEFIIQSDMDTPWTKKRQLIKKIAENKTPKQAVTTI